jgi:uncharacterized membrane protein (TIGR02234 family)
VSGSARRELVVALSVLVVGGVLCLVFAGRMWGEAVVDDGLSTSTELVTGRDLLPLAPAVGILGLAAVVAIPATRRTGRRIVGVVLALAGLATAVATFRLALDLHAEVTDWVERSIAGGSVSEATANTGLAVLTGAGALLITAVGVAVAIRGPQWPGMGRRYEREPRPAETSRPESSRETWDALDRGDDPTA